MTTIFVHPFYSIVWSIIHKTNTVHKTKNEEHKYFVKLSYSYNGFAAFLQNLSKGLSLMFPPPTTTKQIQSSLLRLKNKRNFMHVWFRLDNCCYGSPAWVSSLLHVRYIPQSRDPEFKTSVCFTARELALDKVHIINPKFVPNTHQPTAVQTPQREKQAVCHRLGQSGA